MRTEKKVKEDLFVPEEKTQNDFIRVLLHAGHYIPYGIKSFFSDPFKEEKK